MKKKIMVLLLATLTGCLLAFFTLTKFQPKNKEEESIALTVLQAGIFSSYENALEQKMSFENAVIVKEKEHFSVLVGASTNEKGLNKIEKLLNEKNIHYYKKQMNIMEKDKDLFYKYNMLLERAENDETVLLLSRKILEKVSEV